MYQKEKAPFQAWASRCVDRTVTLVNRVNQYLFVLFVLLLFFLRFKLHINEEHYMVLAKQFYEPEWIPSSFTFNEFASTRVLYQYVAGFMLDYLPFEVASFLGVLLLSLAMAFPLYKIYQFLNLANTEILLHLPILYFSFQSFFGGESIFLSFEPKTIGYLFVLLALFHLLKERYFWVVLFGVLATYFHILVGGWFMFYFLLYHLVSHRSLKKTFWLGAAYAVSMLPFMVYLYPVLSDNFSTAEAPVNPDWIYTYFLQPFHTALFMSVSYFAKEHLEGVLLATAFFVLCLFVFPRLKQGANTKMNRFSILLYLGTCLALAGAYFDRTGAFVKYFPFRVNALFAFLVFLQLVLVTRYFFLRPEALKLFQFGVVALFVLVFLSKAAYGLVLIDAKRYFTNTLVDPEFSAAVDYIRNNSAEEEVVLLLPKSATPGLYYTFDMEPSFVRKAERDWFVAFLEAPLSPGAGKINEWYQRLKAKEEVILDNRKLCQLGKDYRIDYVLSDYVLQDIPCCQLIENNENYYLYRLRKTAPGEE